MKYMMLLTRAEWQDSGSEEERQRHFAAITEWWGRQAGQGKIVEGHQLQGPDTATTVVLNERGDVTVHDGPFMESKETIGGYGVAAAGPCPPCVAVAAHTVAPGGLRPCDRVRRPSARRLADRPSALLWPFQRRRRQPR